MADRLQNRQLAADVGFQIGARILQRVADAGLGREMQDGGPVRQPADDPRDRVRVGYVDLLEPEPAVVRQPGQPGLLQRRIVVGVEIVDPDDLIPTRQQGGGTTHADKAGGAGNQDGHGGAVSGGRNAPQDSRLPSARQRQMRRRGGLCDARASRPAWPWKSRGLGHELARSKPGRFETRFRIGLFRRLSIHAVEQARTQGLNRPFEPGQSLTHSGHVAMQIPQEKQNPGNPGQGHIIENLLGHRPVFG